MTHGSLFSGIGGFDLAARWMGWDNLFHVEFNPWCRKVLEYHFPESVSYTDVKTFDGTIWRGRVDVLSGGFPCQPYSAAGKRLGKDDERHLWPEMRRIISEVAPAYVVGENVRGLTNWNGGVVFEEVCVDLESEGYEVWTGILPACGVGAPHRRDRIWFVAYAPGRGNLGASGRLQSEEGAQRLQERHGVSEPFDADCVRDAANATSNGNSGRPKEICSEERRSDNQKFAKLIECGAIRDAADTKGTGIKSNFDKRREQESYNKSEIWYRIAADGEIGDVADTDGVRLEHGTQSGSTTGGQESTRERIAGHSAPACWTRFPTQPPVCGGDDGIPRELDGITFSKWRNESIKAYGNAIVPQVAHAIFRAIFDTEARF